MIPRELEARILRLSEVEKLRAGTESEADSAVLEHAGRWKASDLPRRA
jgi:hypothetical protein